MTQPNGFGWMSSDLNEYGAVGDAAKATAAKGEACAERGADAFVDLLRDVAGVRPRPARQGPDRLKMGAPDFAFERELIARGRALVAGVDEVGRGPLAGPVGVAAVILDPDDLPEGRRRFEGAERRPGARR